MTARLVPELDVTDLDASLAFYIGACGFRYLYGRSEERFAYLDREGAELMLEEADGPGRRFTDAPLETPFGRGMNLQIEVTDVMDLLERVSRTDQRIVVPLEERWYRRDDRCVGSHQFVVADPDGYLLRFFRDLGERPCDA